MLSEGTLLSISCHEVRDCSQYSRSIVPSPFLEEEEHRVSQVVMLRLKAQLLSFASPSLGKICLFKEEPMNRVAGASCLTDSAHIDYFQWIASDLRG